MATKKSNRKYPLVKPCKMGRAITRRLGKGTRSEIAERRQALAKALKVSDGYLRFLERGEVDDQGKPMRPSAELEKRFKVWLGRQRKAAKRWATPTAPGHFGAGRLWSRQFGTPTLA